MTPRRLADLVAGLLATRVRAAAPGLAPVVVDVVSAAPHAADFTTNAVLRAASTLGVDATSLADSVADELGTHADVAEAVVVAPGHLNVTATLASLVGEAHMAATSAALAAGPADPLPARWRVLAHDVGEDVARWQWAKDPDADPDRLDRHVLTSRRLDNPVFRVLYAHARASAACRVATTVGADTAALPPAPGAFAGTARRRVLVAVADLAGPTLPPDPAGRRRGTLRRLDALAAAYLDAETPTGVPCEVAAASDQDVVRCLLAAATSRLLADGCARLGFVPPRRI